MTILVAVLAGAVGALTAAVLLILADGKLVRAAVAGASDSVVAQIRDAMRLLTEQTARTRDQNEQVQANVDLLATLELRLNALEHRIGVVERYQLRVLEAEQQLRDRPTP